jgi:hypothetical protein
VETPIVFVDRRAGQSKMSWRIIIEAMVQVWWLRLGGSLGPGRLGAAVLAALARFAPPPAPNGRRSGQSGVRDPTRCHRPRDRRAAGS